MLVQFSTDASVQAQGFEASYSSLGSPPSGWANQPTGAGPPVPMQAPVAVAAVQPCFGSVVQRNMNGYISDGSGTFAGYGNNMQCSWRIEPVTPPSQITLRFSSFDTEAGYDFVSVYSPCTSMNPERLSGSMGSFERALRAACVIV